MEPRFYAHFSEAGPRQAWPVPDAPDATSAAKQFLASHRLANPEIERIAITVIDRIADEHRNFQIDLRSGEAIPCD